MKGIPRLKRWLQLRAFKPDKAISIIPTMRMPPERLGLKALQDGWRVGGGPDFVGVGVPKAGTSWWYQLILEHPEVVPNRVGQKELHFFSHGLANRGCQSDTDLYRNCFARPSGALCGEWTPGYFSYPIAIDLLARTAPRAKILLLLRDPIERAISHIAQITRIRAKYLTSDKDRQYVFKTFCAFPEAIAASRYGSSARTLLRFFPREQVLILQYERCVANVEEAIARTYRFLGIDDSFSPPSSERRINASPRAIKDTNDMLNACLSSDLADEIAMLIDLLPDIDLDLWPVYQGAAKRL